MILSERQYAVSKEAMAKLQQALNAVTADRDKPKPLREIELKALASQIADIQGEISEYELLKSGAVSFAESFSLEDLPRVLVQARIARGLSQTEMARRLGMKAQQLQRYEATDYMSASLARLIDIANALDVNVSESFSAGDEHVDNSLFAWTDVEHVDWTRFPLKEMAKRRWLSGANLVQAAQSYFLTAAGAQFATALHRKKVRSGNAPNKYALLAWQARVLELAEAVAGKGRVGEFKLDDAWIRELVTLTRDERGPRKARDLLLQNGVVLVVERHLSGTYLDGAAMMSASGYPVVALTLRYDRLDNFWFVLFHELGHVFLHLYGALRLDFFDEEDGGKSDRIELEADRFALNSLIREDVWRKCLSRFALTEEAVHIDADALGISPSIIAGRIRKERNDYQILKELIGAGTVRVQLEEVLL